MGRVQRVVKAVMSFRLLLGSSKENKDLKAKHFFVQIQSYYDHRLNNKFIIIKSLVMTMAIICVHDILLR